jgi:hypothetical protein
VRVPVFSSLLRIEGEGSRTARVRIQRRRARIRLGEVRVVGPANPDLRDTQGRRASISESNTLGGALGAHRLRSESQHQRRNVRFSSSASKCNHLWLRGSVVRNRKGSRRFSGGFRLEGYLDLAPGSGIYVFSAAVALTKWPVTCTDDIASAVVAVFVRTTFGPNNSAADGEQFYTQFTGPSQTKAFRLTGILGCYGPESIEAGQDPDQPGLLGKPALEQRMEAQCTH